MAVTPKRLADGSQLTVAAVVYYTSVDGKTRIDALALTNTTGGAVTATVHLVPSGNVAAASNCVCSARSVPAGATIIPPGVIGQWLEIGGTLQALAGSGTSITMVASGVEYT